MYARIKEALVLMLFDWTSAEMRSFLGNVTEDCDISQAAPHVRFLCRRGHLRLSLDRAQAPSSDLPAGFVGARLRCC